MKKRPNVLVNRGFSYLGMINEARAKCILLKNRVQLMREDTDTDFDLYQSIEDEVKQIQSDISKYTRKLEKVNEELKEYGFVSELE